jgi:hypothetical protein
MQKSIVRIIQRSFFNRFPLSIFHFPFSILLIIIFQF